LLNQVDKPDQIRGVNVTSTSKNISGLQLMSLQDNYLGKLKQQFAFSNCEGIPMHELYETCSKLKIEYNVSETKTELCNKIKQNLFGQVTTTFNK
jgi:hypothetical protein